jgi:ABC-2 type transport system ATP-binding protein
VPAPAVIVEGVSKSFSLPKERVHTLKERALHPFRRTEHETLHALNGVSFEVGEGEFFGIVGRNGSGKSTLLKCLAGIYKADTGRMLVSGRMSTFIELGVGFNPDLAARDNAILNAIMLGLPRRDAAERYEQVIDFAGLREFENMKLKNYSSGMLVRLAFSVMIQVDADVLLIDEVLAVGDAAFQQKCYDELDRLRDDRRTVLFVTHDMPSVQRFCDRAMLLERGDIAMIDEAERVAAKYFDVNFRSTTELAAAGAEDEVRRGDGSASILEAWFENAQGEAVSTLPQGAECTFCARIRFHEEVRDPHFGATFIDGEHHVVFAASSIWHSTETGTYRAGETTTLRIGFENWFAPARYWASVSVARRGSGDDVLDYREKIASVIVSGTRPAGGLVDLPHELTLERSGASPTPEVQPERA